MPKASGKSVLICGTPVFDGFHKSGQLMILSFEKVCVVSCAFAFLAALLRTENTRAVMDITNTRKLLALPSLLEDVACYSNRRVLAFAQAVLGDVPP